MPGPGQPLGGVAGAPSPGEKGTPDAASGDGPTGPPPPEDPAPQEKSTSEESGSPAPGDPAAPHDRQATSQESTEPPGAPEPAADAVQDKQPVDTAKTEPPAEDMAQPGAAVDEPTEQVAVPQPDRGQPGAGDEQQAAGAGQPPEPEAEAAAAAPAEPEAEPQAEPEAAAPAEPEAAAPAEPEEAAPAEPEEAAPAEPEAAAAAEPAAAAAAEPAAELKAEAPAEPEAETQAEAEDEGESGRPADINSPTVGGQRLESDFDGPTVVIDWSRIRIGAAPAAEPEAAPPAEPEAEASAEPEAAAPAKPEAEPQAEPEAAAPAEPEVEAPAEPEAAAPAKPEAEPQAEPEAAAPAEPEAAAPAEPEAEPQAEPEAEPQAEPEAAAPAEREAEPQAEPEAAAPAEPEAAAPAEPEPAAPAEVEVGDDAESGPPAGVDSPTEIVRRPKPDLDPPTITIDWSQIRTGAPPPGVHDQPVQDTPVQDTPVQDKPAHDQPTVPIQRSRVAPRRPRPSAPPSGPVAPRPPASAPRPSPPGAPRPSQPGAPRPSTPGVRRQPSSPFTGPAPATHPKPTDQRAAAQQQVSEQRPGPERAEVAPQIRPPVEKARPRSRPRRTVLLVTGALLVCVCLGAGVAFRRPLLAAAGFGDPVPVPTTQPPPSPIDPTPALRPVRGEAPAPTPGGVTTALAGPVNSAVLGTVSGSVLDAATGTVLWDHSAAQPLLPASTAKLLTSAAALLTLDHQARLSTTVVRGTEQGSVVLVGGGDPTLATGSASVYPGAPKLDDLVAQVRANAGGSIRKVYYDVSRYTADGLAPGWDVKDVLGGNIAPIVPLMLDGARDRPTELDPPRNPAPAQAAAVEFAKRLGLGASAVAVGTAPQGAAVLGKVDSAPIEDLINNALQISDNVLAEVIGREVAKAAGAEPSFAGVTRTVLDALAHNGFSTADMQMSDGSGLSLNDRVPARLLSAVLAVAASPNNADPRVAKLRPLLGGLPVAGGTGTLTGRYRDPLAGVGKGWVRAKTGTLTGANGLAGIVLDTEGRLLVFAFISNSATPPDAVRPALDTMAATLRGCGCHTS